jgi:GMP synthase (glutamine-hydrolysing)
MSEQSPDVLSSWEQSSTNTPRGVLLTMGSQSEEAARRLLSDMGVEMDTLPGDTPAELLLGYDIVLGSGGADSVYDDTAPKIDPRIFGKDFKPTVIGICLTAQMMVHFGGGRVTPGHQADMGTFGDLEIKIIDDRPEGGFDKITEAKFVHSNGDHMNIDGMPEGFIVTAMTGDHVAAFIVPETGNIGFQFHPELSGVIGFGLVRSILRNKGFNLQPKTVDMFEHIVEEINEQAGDDDLVVGFSGGIDSNLVAEAVLAGKVAKDKIHIVHFDLGVNRTENGIDESEAALDRFEQRTGIRPDLVKLNPATVFHQPVMLIDQDGNQDGEFILSQAIDSETKRKIFSQMYANVFTGYITNKGLDINKTKIVQGTLYPDVIESLGKGKVKTHHNQSPIMVYWEKTGRTIHPLKRLFKNDVRTTSRSRNFAEEDWQRQPFPGPGFIPRIVCSDGQPILPNYSDSVWNRAKEIVGDEFGVILGGFKTVGQKGDKRSYAWPIMLSGEEDWERMAYLTQELGNRLPKDINRIYHISGDRVDGISSAQDMTVTRIDQESIGQLRPIDDHAMRLIRYYGALSVTDQVPIGLLPSSFRLNRGDRTVFLRPFSTPKTNSFLNGVAVRPDQEPAIAAWYEDIKEFSLIQAGISRVAFDLTNKPFGSTEAE